MRLSVRDVAEILGVPENTVTGWVRNDALPADSVGGEFRFNAMQLLEWASTRDVVVSDALIQLLDEDGAASPSLAQALQVGGILPRVAGQDKISALSEIVDALVLPATFDREALTTLLLSRPNLGCSLTSDGIAIPHPRYPIILPLSRPTMTLSLLQTPLPVAAERGPRRTIDALFLLVSPTVCCHLSLVARLAAALGDQEFRDLIKRRSAPDHVFRSVQRLEGAFQHPADETLGSPKRAR